MTPPAVRTIVWLRTAVSIVAGMGVGVVITPVIGVFAGILSGWAAFALVNVIWVLLTIWPMDAAQTRAHATLEAPGRRVARLVSTLGSVVSLGAVLVVIVQAQQLQGVQRYVLAGIAVASVAASWALIQVEYMLRYARMYHSEPFGGIDFNQDDDPEYTDFAYFAVNLGMTYQVSDTDVGQNGIRRMVIAHTLLSYVFGTVILASIVSLVVGLG